VKLVKFERGCAWRCELFRQAVSQLLMVLRRLAHYDMCPLPGGLEAVAPSGTCPSLGGLTVVGPSCWTL